MFDDRTPSFDDFLAKVLGQLGAKKAKPRRRKKSSNGLDPYGRPERTNGDMALAGLVKLQSLVQETMAHGSDSPFTMETVAHVAQESGLDMNGTNLLPLLDMASELEAVAHLAGQMVDCVQSIEKALAHQITIHGQTVGQGLTTLIEFEGQCGPGADDDEGYGKGYDKDE